MRRTAGCLLCFTSLALLASWGVLARDAADDAGGLVAHWPLGGDCRDHSGNGHDGRNRGANLDGPGPDGKPRGAARFDGRNAWIEVPASPLLRLDKSDFTISVWVRTDAELDDVPGDIVSKYDPVRRTGFNFGIQNNAGVTSNQPNYRHVHFGIDSGRSDSEWSDCGRPGNAMLVFALAVYEGQLFAGTCEAGREESGHVYRYDGGANWTDCGSPAPCNSVSSLAVFGGKLYAGVSRYRLAGSALTESENPHLGGNVFRYDGERRWIDCGQLPETEAIGGMVVYRGRLYASSLYRPAGFFRYDGDRSWTACATPDGKRVESLCVWNGSIFASSYDGGHVYRFDGESWTDCGRLGENTQTYSFASHAGRLYVGTWPSGRVYRYAGDPHWQDTGRLGEELEVMGMAVHNGKLYAGTLPLAEVFRYDGDGTWTSTGRLDRTPDVKYRRAWTMAEFDGKLFCGTLPSGRVLSFEAGKSVTCDRELAAGWGHLIAMRAGDRLKLYVDGKLAATSTPLDAARYDLTNDQPLKIGFGADDYFNGSLSDLRIYDRALTDGEVEALSRR